MTAKLSSDPGLGPMLEGKNGGKNTLGATDAIGLSDARFDESVVVMLHLLSLITRLWFYRKPLFFFFF